MEMLDRQAEDKDRMVNLNSLRREFLDLSLSEKIKKSNEALLTVLDSLDAAVYVADMGSYEILYVNKYLHKIFGNIVGKTCWQVLQANQTGPCEFCTNKKLLSNDGTPTGVYVWEFQNTLNDHWYDIHDKAIRWIDGRMVRLEIATDITKRKRAEEQVKEHTKELEEANRLKELFTDIIRHDLINPAGIISGAAEAMLIDYPDHKEMKMIKRNANRLIEIIENAGMLSKLESVEKLEKKSLDLKELLENAIIDIQPHLEATDLQVQNKVAVPMPIMASTAMEDVFINLLSNAAKYAGDGKRIVVDAKDKGKAYVVKIKDYGPGVPDADKEDIFIRFTRRPKRGVKGTGLGLAIAKKIVEFHKGRIWVEDNPKGGSIFCVEIPKA
jgi:PAS domain S-box-containing protein